MEGRLIINVGGTKFETTLSTIESKPDTMVEMLLKHHVSGEELFIDRNSRLFEWVLYWYRTGVLVDHVTVGVPQEVWDLELDFYLVKMDEAQCLGEMEPKKRKLAEKENALLQKAIQLKEKLSAEDEKQKQHRCDKYQDFIEYILDNMKNSRSKTFEFVASGGENKPNIHPMAYPRKLQYIQFSFLNYYFKEFQQVCADIGLDVKNGGFNDAKTGWKYLHLPASLTHFAYKHEYWRIEVTVTK